MEFGGGMRRWLLVFGGAFSLAGAWGLDVRVSLPLNPPMIVDETHGPLVTMIQAMGASFPQDRVTVTGVFPFARSVQNVIAGRADLHVPLIRNPHVPDAELPYDFTTQSLGFSVFVLYTNRGNPQARPDQAGKLSIEVEPDHLALFPHLGRRETPVDSGLRRVAQGSLDAYLCSMDAGDEALKRLGLTTVKRWEFETFMAYGVIAKGTRGGPVDQWFTQAFLRLQAEGKTPESRPFVDW